MRLDNFFVRRAQYTDGRRSRFEQILVEADHESIASRQPVAIRKHIHILHSLYVFIEPLRIDQRFPNPSSLDAKRSNPLGARGYAGPKDHAIIMAVLHRLEHAEEPVLLRIVRMLDLVLELLELVGPGFGYRWGWRRRRGKIDFAQLRVSPEK